MKLAIILQRILPPVWFGMVVAIGAEAQLKFQAPGITRELGLGIGKLIFTWLNRAECIVATVLAIALLAFSANKNARIIFGFILTILAAQTFWLIPRLVERIDAITSGQSIADSSIHFVYITLEVSKILLLLALSITVNRRV
jgi:hypothetical protein